jgi:Xaa-Pro aminopeptidase
MPGVPPAYIEQYGMYTNPARAQLLARLKGLRADMSVVDISRTLSRLRMVKQSEEIAAIQAAIDITAVGIEEVLTAAKSGTFQHEYEVEARLTAAFRTRRSGHAFEPIVAAGKRACTLHNVSNEGPIGPSELVVMDVGAEVEHYAADITRTVCFGTASTRQQAVYDSVLDVQKYAMGLLKPGITLHDYERQVEKYMGEKLMQLGLIETNDHDSVRRYFPHATSHFLGLNVHDAGDYEIPLQAGMVLTVEPGIYIPEESIGVRIEDDVLMEETGIKVLSDALPRRLG